MASPIVLVLERIIPDRITIRSGTGITPDSSPAVSGSPLSKAKPAIFYDKSHNKQPERNKGWRETVFPGEIPAGDRY